MIYKVTNSAYIICMLECLEYYSDTCSLWMNSDKTTVTVALFGVSDSTELQFLFQ